MGTFARLPTIAATESFSRIFVDLTLIAVGFGAIQALGICVRKNPK